MRATAPHSLPLWRLFSVWIGRIAADPGANLCRFLFSVPARRDYERATRPLECELVCKQREWTASGLTECATRRRRQNVTWRLSVTPSGASLVRFLDAG